MAAVGNDRAVRDDAAGRAIGRGNAVPRSAARHGVIGAAVVVELDELVVRAVGAADAELADDQLGFRGNGREQRAGRDGCHYCCPD